VKAAFADTFYWIALTVPTDGAHARASQFKDDFVTTDEVLCAYLTFFCSTPEHMRRKAASIPTTKPILLMA
jgi:hypothetical protein